MIFKLETAGDFYPDKKSRDMLEKYGFRFKHDTEAGETGFTYSKIEDRSLTIELNTIGDMMKFIAIVGEIIVSDQPALTITIYDNYVE